MFHGLFRWKAEAELHLCFRPCVHRCVPGPGAGAWLRCQVRKALVSDRSNSIDLSCLIPLNQRGSGLLRHSELNCRQSIRPQTTQNQLI